MFYRSKNTALWTYMVRSLKELDDVRSIGVVVTLWHDDSGRRATFDTSPRLDALLIRLLRRLEPKDGYLLNARRRRWLHEELTGYNVPLVAAILEALYQIGDGTAVRFVEPLARGRGLAAKEPQIRTAAAACLPLLRARAEFASWLTEPR